MTPSPALPPNDSDVPGMLPAALAGQTVEQLVDVFVDAIVRSGGDTRFGRMLVAELERRGGEVMWESVLLVLGPLSARPVLGLAERAGVDHLRYVARTTPDAAIALVSELQAVHRDEGAQAAREVWEQAPVYVQHAALLQLVIAVCWSFGSDNGRLTPAQTVALIRATVAAPRANCG